MPDEEESTSTSEPESGGSTSEPKPESDGGQSRTGSAFGAAAKHEFTAEDRTGAHRLVATAMIITFLTVAISQDWWKHLRDFVATKTHGPAPKAKPGG